MDATRMACAWYLWKTRDNPALRQKLCDRIFKDIQAVAKDPKRRVHDMYYLAAHLGPLGGREQLKQLLSQCEEFYCCYGPALIEALAVIRNEEDVPFLISQMHKETESSYGLTSGVLNKWTYWEVHWATNQNEWRQIWQLASKLGDISDLDVATDIVSLPATDGKAEAPSASLLAISSQTTTPTFQRWWLLDRDTGVAKPLEGCNTSMTRVRQIKAAPDNRHVGIVSVGEGHSELEIFDLPTLLEGKKPEPLQQIDPYPGGVWIKQWADDGKLHIESGMLLTHRDKDGRVPPLLEVEGVYSLDPATGKIEAVSDDAKHPVRYFLRNLHSSDDYVVSDAIQGLRLLKAREALPVLRRMLQAENDPDAKMELQQAIDKLSKPEKPQPVAA